MLWSFGLSAFRPPDLAFAFRTTVAALLSLGLALELQLESPQWAPMTVWVVAQSTRGESLSKARWRAVGTIGGAAVAVILIASFTQSPVLFVAALSIWIGLCTGFAVLTRNFRAYSLVLAGYTCAIVALDATARPLAVLGVALARSSDILLGIATEFVVASLFTPGADRAARQSLVSTLTRALAGVTELLSDMLAGDVRAVQRSRPLFGSVVSQVDRVEFLEEELYPVASEGDHARAALAGVLTLATRGLEKAVEVGSLDKAQEEARTALSCGQSVFHGLSLALSERDLRQAATQARQIHYTLLQPAPSALEIPSGRNERRGGQALEARLFNQTLVELVGELLAALDHVLAIEQAERAGRFRYRFRVHRDPTEAARSGLRTAVTVMAAGLFWIATEWPNGGGFVSTVAIACGLFGARENRAVATLAFLRGAVAAASVAAFLDLLVVPAVSGFPMLAASFALPMLAGGLAARRPATATAAASYNLFLPSLVVWSNATRIDEIQFFNAALATLSGIGFTSLMFRVVLPFSADDERRRIRRTMLRGLRRLARGTHGADVSDWLSLSADRLGRLVRHAGSAPSPSIEAHLQGALAATTIGMNAIRLNAILDERVLPPSAYRPVRVTMQRMRRLTARHGRTARAARNAAILLERLESREGDDAVRLALTRAISSLRVISRELELNAAFLGGGRDWPL